MKKSLPALIGLLLLVILVVVFLARPARSPVNFPAVLPGAPVAVAPVAPPPLDIKPITDFAQWRRAAQVTPPTAAQLDEGRQLATARRAVMLRLMREQPARALEQAVTWSEWAALPADLRALVERPFSETADLSVVPDERPVNARTTPWPTYRVELRGEWLDVFVYGRRETMSTKLGTPLQGIRLEQQLALWESPALALAAPDLAAAQTVLPDGSDRAQSWLTGQPINGEPVAALLGGKIHYFADAGEVAQVAAVIADAEALPGPHTVAGAMAAATGGFGGTFNAKAFTTGSSLAKSLWTETPKRLLMMIVNFTPSSVTNYTSNVLVTEFLGASNTFREMSFNKTWQSNTMVPQTLFITNAQSYWETNSTGADGIMATAKGLAATLGYVLTNYDIYVVAMPYLERHAGAAAFAGGQHLWMNGGPWGAGVPTHELGHNYGYGHANHWRGNTGAGFLGHTNGSGGVIEHEEYGDPFEIMGDAYASYPQGHFNMQAKNLFNWIETNEVTQVATGGVYRVRRFDHVNSRVLAGGKLALLVTNAVGDRFWIGYRRAPTNTIYAAVHTGAYVIWGHSPGSHRLIDTTRLSVPNGGPAGEKLDAPLQPGQAWTDPSGTLRLTTLGAGGSSPNEYLDVEVQLLTSAPPYQLFTTAAATTNGLLGSYVNTSLRGYAPQDDWRMTQTISGTRVDPAINFISTGWGARAPVGVTGGSDADWDNYSVQWDGWVQVSRATKFATRSDDGSRLWIDFNGNAAFATNAPEYINNNWGNGQAATLGEISATVPPGLYRIRLQYEEGGGGNSCQLVASPVEFDLFTDAALTTNGLIGSYVNSGLRAYAPQDDWRTSQTISGTRRDAYPLYLENAFAAGSWGNRTNVGVTGGTADDWDNYSVQWDGWIRLYQPMRYATLSDDSSRLWIDVNNNGAFATAAPEYINNHWGTGQGDTYGDTGATVPPGTYRFRIQYEEGGGGNHFALYAAPQETPGPSGYALYFDGVDDFMIVSNAGLSLPTGEVTVEFWQRVYEQRDQFTFILSPDNTANRFSFATPWADGNAYWDLGNTGGGGRLLYVPTTNAIGTWQHWAVVSSVAGSYQRIYRNGVLETGDATAVAFAQTAAHLVLGGRAAEALKGELDEFRIWSVARSQAEIQANLTCRVPTPQTGLWAYWRFDEGTGTTVADLSGNNRHGTLVGGTVWNVSTIPTLQTTFTNVVTTLADSGAGSLRAAITNVNACDCSSVITFAVNGTINLASSLPFIFSSATILGPGANNLTINGGGAYPIFGLGGGTTNRISGLRLANAFSINAGAAVNNSGRTVLENCAISNSVTVQSFGGAVANFGSSSVLFATNCVFVNNRIRGGDGEHRGPGNNGGPGGGGAGMGGAIYTEGASLTLSGCAFVGNVAAGGNGGNGDGNSGSAGSGGHGGFPNRGLGGAVGLPGGAGGVGGGGGGGAGSAGAGYAGGTGGFGGGGGAGGARGAGGDGGVPGVGGLYGGGAGASFASHSGGGGGGAGLGGAIFARTGAVTVENCSFTGNLATNGVGGNGSFGGGNGANGQGVGGAVFIDTGATYTLGRVTYTGNIATTDEPSVEISTHVTTLADSGPGSLRQAIANAAVHPGADSVTFAANLSGGVIALTSAPLMVADSSGAVLITATNLPQGLALDGQGARRIFNIVYDVTLDSLTVTNCSIGLSDGGGISSGGNLTIRRCSFIGNAALYGGAVASFGPSASLTIERTTFSRNSASGGGGAIWTSGLLRMDQCTVVSNTAGSGGGIRLDSPANGFLTNTLLAGNWAGTASNLHLFSGTVIGSHNLVGDNGGNPFTNGLNGNLVGSVASNINPRLGALRDNGGPTLTHAPLGGSPALDAGNPLLGGLGLTDQRGYPRISNSRVDIGAVENGLILFYPVVSSTLVDVSGTSTAQLQGAGVPLFGVSRNAGSGSSLALNDPSNTASNYYRLRTATTNNSAGDLLTNDFTVSVWAWNRGGANTNGWKVILGLTGGASGADNPVFGLLNGRPYLSYWGSDVAGSRVIAPTTWTHYAWTYRRQGGQIALYVNGLLDVSTVGHAHAPRAGDLLVGFSEALAGSYFQGALDDLAIFGEALSASQITALASNTVTPDAVLPAPVLSPGLAAAACGWNVREIYAHTNDPALYPNDLPSALHVANTPQSAKVTNYTSTVINRYDSKYNPPNSGFLGGDVLFASNDKTPQGLIDGDDDYFVLAAQAVIQIAVEDDYTFGFSSDDGAQLRLKGAVFTNSTRLDLNNPANPAHRGDTLSYPGNTANSQTLGVTHLTPGSYEVEFISWELGGGAFTEVIAARGAKTSVDSSFALLSPLLFSSSRPPITISRVPASVNVQLNWSASACYRLQSAAIVTGPWSDVVNGTNGVVVTTGAGAQFFRLAE